ncbi:lysozyme [Mesorhizobium loti]|uniref:lysozyme n=1 Tax=Rhizobium loti TaxID=381 RepID=UPI001475915C|nr:lysozyme [Mesorhizobium loti]
MWFRPAVLALAVFASAPANAQSDLENQYPSNSQIEDLKGALGAVPLGSARELTKLGFDLIKHFEGWSAAAYDDPSKYCTIGYGHLIALKPCRSIDLNDFSKPLTDPQGIALLEKDTRSARASVEKLVKVDLSDDQFSALSSFVFNVGKDNFANSSMLSLINESEFDKASKQFGRWVKSKGKVLPGLVTRRACEATLFVSDLTYGKNGKFSEAQCETLGAVPTADLVDLDVGEAN